MGGLLAANPKGLVPTLALEGKQPIYESLICVEYASDLSTNGMSLLPKCPTQRAYARIQADWVNKNICSPFYRILVRTDPEERREGFETMQKNLEIVAKEIKGPFFFGESMSVVDIDLFPWMYRVIDAKIVEKYRSWSFQMPSNLETWYSTMLAQPSVISTLADPGRLSDTYKRYADATAESAVGDALRKGKDAHDID